VTRHTTPVGSQACGTDGCRQRLFTPLSRETGRCEACRDLRPHGESFNITLRDKARLRDLRARYLKGGESA
jgi:hypothetical protein